ncbi:hypothetical protein, partial [Mycobacterium avium]|uniref:hypothetical protein n=1 Tax=Mycobacterium avium TaxID=1764 RepID=UPI001F236115
VTAVERVFGCPVVDRLCDAFSDHLLGATPRVLEKHPNSRTSEIRPRRKFRSGCIGSLVRGGLGKAA